MRYERARSNLRQAERTVIMTLRSNIDSEIGKRVLEGSLNLVQGAAERCRLAQAESVQKAFSQRIGME